MEQKRSTAKLGRPVRVSGEKPTREKIFDAAVDLFAEQGYDGTSVRQIARAVGLTESAVYRHYPSKEAVLDAVISFMESWITSPLSFEVTHGGLEGRRIFRELLESLPDSFAANPGLVKIMRIMYAEMPHNRKIRRYVKIGHEVRSVDGTEALFKRCAEKGLIRTRDIRGLAIVFNAFRFQWCYQVSVLDRDEALDAKKLKRDLQAPLEFFETFLAPEKRKFQK